MLAEYGAGAKHAIAVNNCTAALRRPGGHASAIG
jgi:dTDP-4-amino-4,6-dideoxygalactose transaminase